MTATLSTTFFFRSAFTIPSPSPRAPPVTIAYFTELFSGANCVRARRSGCFLAAARVFLSIDAQQRRKHRHNRGSQEQAKRPVRFEPAENTEKQRDSFFSVFFRHP